MIVLFGVEFNILFVKVKESVKKKKQVIVCIQFYLYPKRKERVPKEKKYGEKAAIKKKKRK